jgi:DNA-binding response OmpR family regulator
VTTVLLATDADWIYDEVDAALGGDGTSVYRVRAGVDVVPACRHLEPDLLVIDMQIGSMGGMATCMAVRQEEEAGRLPVVAVLMLLDREPDTFLARRSDTDGWLVKPIDAFRLRRAAAALLAGGDWFEGAEATPTPLADGPDDAVEGAGADDLTAGEIVTEPATADAG